MKSGTASDPVRRTGIVAVVVAAIVMVTTVLVLSPPGTPLRDQVRSLALPYFGQNWRVFAPNILKTNRTLEIRAQWRDDAGDLVRSDWVSITAIELRAVAGHVVPSRIAKSSWNASSTYLQRYQALDELQREAARDTFIEAYEGGFRPVPDGRLIERLGADDPDVIRFLRMDYMMMRNATMYATAGFGHPIERVQWRVVRQRPNDFANRFVQHQQFRTATTTFGWRQANVRVEPRVVQAYRDLIRRHGAGWVFQEAS